MYLRTIAVLLCCLLSDLGLSWLVYESLPHTKKLSEGLTLERRTSDGKIFSFVAGPKNKKYIRLQQIPKYLKDAVLVLEDSRFYQHLGFDVVEIQKVLLAADETTRLRGASTITQQLAKNLYLSPERTLKRKFIEALITVKLELTLTKNQILELYLNSIDWGRGLFGISDATAYYFKKDLSQLNLRESVFLAAIIPNPSRFGRFTEDRLPKKFVRTQMMKALKEMYALGFIDFGEFQDVMEKPYEFSEDF
jgi:membrane peptidoglycan carboxypeptidase